VQQQPGYQLSGFETISVNDSRERILTAKEMFTINTNSGTRRVGGTTSAISRGMVSSRHVNAKSRMILTLFMLNTLRYDIEF
jgi:hypothetical protein